MDELFVKTNRFEASISKLRALPGSSILTLGLLETKNSIERFLWFLKNSDSKYLPLEIGVLTLAFQENFGMNAYSEESAHGLLAGELNVEKEQPSGSSYFLSELTEANELFKFKVLTRLKDFQVLSNFDIEKLGVIPKDSWEAFLRLYCLFG